MKLRWEQRFLARELGDDCKYAEIAMPPVLPQSRRGRQSSGGTKMIIFQVHQDLAP